MAGRGVGGGPTRLPLSITFDNRFGSIVVDLLLVGAFREDAIEREGGAFGALTSRSGLGRAKRGRSEARGAQ